MAALSRTTQYCILLLGNMEGMQVLAFEICDRQLNTTCLQCLHLTIKKKLQTLHLHISGFEMEPRNRKVIPHSILSTKVNLQEGYSQNNSVHPDVH